MEIYGRLQVFGDSLMVRGKGLRTIVAATSCASAARALSEVGICVTAGHVALNWYATCDSAELRIAMTKPGTVFQQKGRHGNFVELEKVQVEQLH